MDQNEKIQAAVEILKTIKLEHCEGAIFIASMNTNNPDKTRMSVMVAGCETGLFNALFEAGIGDEAFRKIIRKVAKKLKTVSKDPDGITDFLNKLGLRGPSKS